MASKAIFFLLVSTVYLSSLAGVAIADSQIQGMVYCDTCRVQFMTSLSTSLEGAIVKLECKSRTNGTITLTKEAVTDKEGNYQIEVTGDHEEELCELVLVQSPDSSCNETFLHNSAKISLTSNDGIVYYETRILNPIGFMAKTPLPECPAYFKELDIAPEVF